VNKIFLFFIFFVSSLSLAEQTFNLNCKVLDQNILAIDEGNSERFSGYKNGIKKGETFSVKFKYFPGETTFGFSLTFPGWIKGYDHPIFDTSKWWGSDSVFITEQVISFGDNNYVEHLFLGYDSIFFRNEYSTYKFKRYYKNDWQLVFFFNDLFEIYSGTANCMAMPNTYNEVLRSMREIYK